MLRIFKESVWDFFWGKVVSVLGIIGIAQTVLSLRDRDYVITVANTDIDYRVWFVFTLALLVAIILRVLYVADKYKSQSESIVKVRIVYNEKNYPACRKTEGDVETIRIGYRVIGKQPIENPVVLPSNLFRIDTSVQYTKIPVTQFPLRAMTRINSVQPGLTPSYWVNVFTHKVGSREIEMCYDNYSEEPLLLSPGCYQLGLIARGTPTGNSVATLHVTVNPDYVLDVAIEGVDSFCTI